MQIVFRPAHFKMRSGLSRADIGMDCQTSALIFTFLKETPNKELKSIQKETVVAKCMLLSQHLHVKTDETLKNPRITGLRPRF